MKRKTDDSWLDPATSEFPSWLSGEQRRRLLLACRSFVLLRKAVSVRRNVFVYCCMLRKGRKRAVRELLFREGLASLLDEHVSIPEFARLKMERKRLFNKKFFWGQCDIATIIGMKYGWPGGKLEVQQKVSLPGGVSALDGDWDVHDGSGMFIEDGKTVQGKLESAYLKISLIGGKMNFSMWSVFRAPGRSYNIGNEFMGQLLDPTSNADGS